NADVSLIIGSKENGQTYKLDLDTDDDLFILVISGALLNYRKTSHYGQYPVPLRIAWQELAAAY
ncbi:hypothetical protein V8F44DRAFT_460627, partial [Aspergillus fumigatus]